MKKNKLVLTATGGIAAAVLLTGGSQAVAQTLPAFQMGMRARHTENAEHDYEDIGDDSSSQDSDIRADDSQEDFGLEKSRKYTLLDQGFSSAQIHKIFRMATHSERGNRKGFYGDE